MWCHSQALGVRSSAYEWRKGHTIQPIIESTFFFFTPDLQFPYRYLICHCLQVLTPYLCPQINQKQEKILPSLFHFVFVVTLNHSLCSHFSITLGSGKDRTNSYHPYEKGPKLPLRKSRLAEQTTSLLKWGRLPIMMSLQPDAGIITSWERDCSPHAVTVITTPVPSESWDNNQATLW
jgi:hypothetical protein